MFQYQFQIFLLSFWPACGPRSGVPDGPKIGEPAFVWSGVPGAAFSPVEPFNDALDAVIESLMSLPRAGHIRPFDKGPLIRGPTLDRDSYNGHWKATEHFFCFEGLRYIQLFYKQNITTI